MVVVGCTVLPCKNLSGMFQVVGQDADTGDIIGQSKWQPASSSLVERKG